MDSIDKKILKDWKYLLGFGSISSSSLWGYEPFNKFLNTGEVTSALIICVAGFLLGVILVRISKLSKHFRAIQR